MPYDIRVENGIILLSYSGKVTRGEVMQSAAGIVRLEATFARHPDLLADLSAITERETDYETLSAVGVERQQRVFPNDWRQAMVATTQVSFGLARMFQTLVESRQIEIRIFATRDEALGWLAEPPSITAG